MPNTYDAGDSVRMAGTFTSIAGTLTDPTTISLIVQDPAGTTTTYTFAGGTVTKDGVGLYSKDLVCNTGGWWYYRYVGTGTVAAACEAQFFIRKAVNA